MPGARVVLARVISLTSFPARQGHSTPGQVIGNLQRAGVALVPPFRWTSMPFPCKSGRGAEPAWGQAARPRLGEEWAGCLF